MTISTLDPQTALIIVDLQRGITANPKAHPLEPIVRNSAALADAFRSHNLPVVLVNVNGGAPVDAMTDLTISAHENSISTMFPRLGETGTTREILDLLKATRS